MDAEMPQSFKDEEQRIRWRSQLMSCPGGVDWLCHLGRLFGWNESILGPGLVGIPRHLALAMWQRNARRSGR